MEAQASVIVYKGPAVLERAVLAAGMAGAVLASQLLPNYPMEWRALLPLAVLGIGLWSTIGAYLAMVAVLAYPIWQLSPYLMVLFVAVAIIPHRLILNHLPLALLIVWSPVLAALHVEFAIPLLAGIFSGARRGAVAGLVTALWIKLYAAMSGNPLDLLLLQGSPGTPAGVAARFAGAGSLDTVMLIGAPFAPNSSELLGNLLQIAAVAGAGAAAGWLAGWGRSRLVLHDLEDAPPLWLRLAARVWWTGIVPVGVGGDCAGRGLAAGAVRRGPPAEQPGPAKRRQLAEHEARAEQRRRAGPDRAGAGGPAAAAERAPPACGTSRADQPGAAARAAAARPHADQDRALRARLGGSGWDGGAPAARHRAGGRERRPD